MTDAVYNVVIVLANIRGALNKSYNDYRVYKEKKQLQDEAQSELDKYKPEKTYAPAEQEAPPEAFTVGEYVPDRQGAVVLVDGDFVVFIEHYQLKHNPDLGVLQAGGPFKGKKGSQMRGGWDAHVSTYAPQVLQIVKAALHGNPTVRGVLPKARTGEMEAYVTIIKEGRQWLIFYHCNPPG
jgi:hypothetical protein